MTTRRITPLIGETMIRSATFAVTFSALSALVAICQSPAYGQEVDFNPPLDRVQLEQRQSDSAKRYGVQKMTASEIRQARALHRSQQRDARIEHNLWIGYEPLRPNWNALPMMSSPYAYKRTIYVPVYIRTR